MSKSDSAKAREQRLAAKLRENLKRRKGQLRARDEAGERLASLPTGQKPEESGKV
jgi:hypothetical protein